MRYFLTFIIGLIISTSSLAVQEELLEAIKGNDLTTAQTLIAEGANPFKPNENGDSAVSVGLMSEEGSEVQQWAQTLVEESALKARVLRNLIEYDILTVARFRAELEQPSFYIDAVSWGGHTLLGQLALLKGKEAYLTTLLSYHPDTEMAGRKQSAPLAGAIELGNVRATKLLISAGASLGALNDSGLTPLHITVDNRGDPSNDGEIARLLIEAGADLNAKDTSEDTPLHDAVKYDRKKMVEVLINAGADPNIPSERGMTPLMESVFKHSPNSLMITQALIQAGANLDAKNVSGYTALHRVALMDVLGQEGCCDKYEEADARVAQLLVEAGADSNATDDNGLTPLLLSIRENHWKVAKALLNSGVDPNGKGNTDITPLELALAYDNTDLARLIIASGAEFTPEIWQHVSAQAK